MAEAALRSGGHTFETPIETQAKIDDGRLDLYRLEVSDLLRLMAIAPKIREGRQRLAAQVRVGVHAV